MKSYVIVWAVFLFFLCPVSRGQESPVFEVVSVKPSASQNPLILIPRLRNGTLRATNVTLRQTLSVAFGLAEARIFGPGWLESDRFDIEAKSPKGVPDTEMKPMLKSLLRDRFLLKTHTERRKMPVYDMSVSASGLKMPVYPAPTPASQSFPSGYPMMRGTLTTDKIAELLSPIVGRPVFDATGLTERYNFALSFAPFTPGTDTQESVLGPPDLFRALSEQLGLKLVANKRDLEVIIVDFIERHPAEN